MWVHGWNDSNISKTHTLLYRSSIFWESMNVFLSPLLQKTCSSMKMTWPPPISIQCTKMAVKLFNTPVHFISRVGINENYLCCYRWNSCFSLQWTIIISATAQTRLNMGLFNTLAQTICRGSLCSTGALFFQGLGPQLENIVRMVFERIQHRQSHHLHTWYTCQQRRIASLLCIFFGCSKM